MSYLRQSQKEWLELNVFDFRTHFPAKKTSLKFQSRSQSDSIRSRCTVSLEKYRICSSHQNPESKNYIKKAIFKDCYRYLNTYVSRTLSLICSIKVPNETLTSVVNDSVEKPIFVILYNNPDSEKNDKCPITLFCFDNQTHIFQNVQVYFFQTRSPSNTFRLWRTIQLRNLLFWSMHRIRDSPNNPNSAIYFDIARYSNF